MVSEPIDPILPEESPPLIPEQPEERPGGVQPGLDELKRQKLEEIKTRLKGGEQKLSGPATKVEPKPAAATIEKATDTRGRARAAGQAIKEGGKVAGQVLKQAGRVAVGFLKRNPVILGIVGVILLIFIIIAVIVSFYALSKQSGNASPNRPTTQVQKSQAGLLAAFAGDKLQQFKIVSAVVTSEQKRYETIATLMKTNPGGASIGATTADLDKVQADLKQVAVSIKAQDRATATLQLKNAITDEKATEAKLPFGTWIANIALGFADANSPYHQDAQICQIADVSMATINNGRRGCGLAVSVILNKAGVPQSVVTTTQELWDNGAYSIVVPRPSALDHALAKNSLPNLKPGDIVWWGNGGGANYGGALFDHVGIYVGDDNAIANSSSSAAVKETTVDRTDKIFNGAKRYAP